MQIVKIYSKKHIKDLKRFCKKCKKIGWYNNSSLTKLKYDETVRNGGGFFAIYENESITSIAGYQKFSYMQENGWRIFYRSATLPESNTNKTLHNGTGPRGRAYIDKFIATLPNQNLYVTTNIENNESKNITRYNRSLYLESKRANSYIEFVTEAILYNTKQNIWKLNIEKYLDKTR